MPTSHHGGTEIRDFLTGLEPGTPVGVETIGSWYWIVDEIEEGGGPVGRSRRVVAPDRGTFTVLVGAGVTYHLRADAGRAAALLRQGFSGQGSVA